MLTGRRSSSSRQRQLSKRIVLRNSLGLKIDPTSFWPSFSSVSKPRFGCCACQMDYFWPWGENCLWRPCALFQGSSLCRSVLRFILESQLTPSNYAGKYNLSVTNNFIDWFYSSTIARLTSDFIWLQCFVAQGDNMAGTGIKLHEPL